MKKSKKVIILFYFLWIAIVSIIMIIFIYGNDTLKNITLFILSALAAVKLKDLCCKIVEWIYKD